MKPGTFVTFEGIDGCGKTTQIQLARTFLEKQGNQVFTTLEPGGTDIGIQIRKILLNQKIRVWSRNPKCSSTWQIESSTSRK